LGIGCGGTVYVALLPITRESNYLQLKEVHQALSQRESGTFQLKIPDVKEKIAARFVKTSTDDNSTISTGLFSEEQATWLNASVNPDPHLLVVGGGVDARPVVSLARELGWEVSLWDSRPANARREYFMSANTILNSPVDQLAQYVLDKKVNAAILMTHYVVLDAAARRALTNAPMKYRGLRGPTARKLKVIETANLVATQIQTDLSGPAGFDLGGELPESIALSMKVGFGSLKTVIRNRFSLLKRSWFCQACRRLSNHTKNTPPIKPVTIPIGMSSGAMMVRAMTSAQTRKTAPHNAQIGSSRR
jgi:xanthine dehydrogenase accessory factor